MKGQKQERGKNEKGKMSSIKLEGIKIWRIEERHVGN